MTEFIDVTEFSVMGKTLTFTEDFKSLHKSKAFTLAEVLIVIGIIGIVAAITIPTLIQNTSNLKFASIYKKTLSTLSQASLTANAMYSMDYSSLNQESESETCAKHSLAKENYTMCGLFNSTLSSRRYEGVLGNLKENIFSSYNISTTTSGFDVSDSLIYSLADGTIVGFKPTAKNCSLKGTVLSKDMLLSGGGLVSCIGFIDVNGVRGPNKEVTCLKGTSEFSTSACVVNMKAISDVFPIVFHDGIVEPATNAARAVLFAAHNSNSNKDGGLPYVDGHGYYDSHAHIYYKYRDDETGNYYNYKDHSGNLWKYEQHGHGYNYNISGTHTGYHGYYKYYDDENHQYYNLIGLHGEKGNYFDGHKMWKYAASVHGTPHIEGYDYYTSWSSSPYMSQYGYYKYRDEETGIYGDYMHNGHVYAHYSPYSRHDGHGHGFYYNYEIYGHYVRYHEYVYPHMIFYY